MEVWTELDGATERAAEVHPRGAASSWALQGYRPPIDARTVVLVSSDVGKIAAELVGRWRIVEMSAWDADAIDMVGPGFVEFTADRTGQLGFIVVRGWLDCRPLVRDGRVGVEFSWQGDDDGDFVSGRGWAVLVDDATIEGNLFFHMGDDSTFRAVPFASV